MKFVLIVEEDGYELRYWDEINEEIRDTILAAWDTNEFYKKLIDMDFNISRKTLAKAINLIESGQRDFVVLSSRKKPGHLDTLHEDYFEIER